MADFGRFRLGKGIVYGKDTPNFVANRIGVYGIMATIHAMMEMDYQVDEVDAITGPAMGHPKSASFGTVDLVGLDTLVHVVNTLREGCPDDEGAAGLRDPGLHHEDDRERAARPQDQGRLLQAREGRRRREDRLRRSTGRPAQYRPKAKLDVPSLKARPRGSTTSGAAHQDARRRRRPRRRLRLAPDCATRWPTPRAASARSPTPSSTSTTRLKWGFNWELGPFETWDALGVEEIVDRMKAEGVEPAPWVERDARSRAPTTLLPRRRRAAASSTTSRKQGLRAGAAGPTASSSSPTLKKAQAGRLRERGRLAGRPRRRRRVRRVPLGAAAQA